MEITHRFNKSGGVDVFKDGKFFDKAVTCPDFVKEMKGFFDEFADGQLKHTISLFDQKRKIAANIRSLDRVVSNTELTVETRGKAQAYQLHLQLSLMIIAACIYEKEVKVSA
jgi:hypothetical protein